MNKRSILFIALMTVTFLVINTFFSSERDETAREELRKKELVKQAEEDRLQKRQAKANITLEDLPLVELYTSESEEAPFSYGLLFDKHVMFLASKSNLPSKLYIRANGEKDVPLQEVSYIYGSSVQGSPQIYGSTQDPLTYADISGMNDLDIQLVSISNNSPENAFAIWEGEKLTIPFAKPETSAIALVKLHEMVLPCGVYQHAEEHFVPLSLYPSIQTHLAKVNVSQAEAIDTNAKQKFYALSSPYQQLIFSNIGASIVGINLPFADENDPESVVNPVEWDRLIIKDAPLNARFPLHEAHTAKGELTPEEGGYYPLIRRNLFLSPTKQFEVPPSLRALVVTSNFPELASLPYKVVAQTKEKIVFEAVQAHRKIRKTFSIPQNPEKTPYLFDLEIEIEGDSRNLWINTGVPESEVSSGIPQATLKYGLNRENKVDVEEISLPKPGESSRMTSVHTNWLANCGPFFGVVLYPEEGAGPGYHAEAIPGERYPSRMTLIDREYNRFPAKDFPAYNLMMPLAPREGKVKLKVYAGPLDASVLNLVDQTLADTTGKDPKLSESQSFHGWFPFISKPISKVLFVIMKFFKNFTSWGVAIILLTVVLRLFLFPLSAWSFRSMKRMQQIAPQVQAIQKKYKKDPKRSQMEVMKLYRQEKVNPFMGCLPILIQMPFLIGMFDLLRSNFALRGTSFISGWIDNLAAPDILFQWSYPVFFIGTEFHLLPLLVGLIMFVQQRLGSNAPKDPSLMTDQQRQQRTMGSIMTIFFSIMFYNLPSGVNLYWLSSMLLGVLQQWYTNRTLDKQYGPKRVEIEK